MRREPAVFTDRYRCAETSKIGFFRNETGNRSDMGRGRYAVETRRKNLSRCRNGETGVTQQEDHMQEDPREGMIEEFLKIPIPSDWYTKDTTQRRAYIVGGYKTYQGETAERSKICAVEVWHECFGYPIATLTQRDTRAINAILSKSLKGWERNNTRYGEEYGRQRGFFKSVPP